MGPRIISGESISGEVQLLGRADGLPMGNISPSATPAVLEPGEDSQDLLDKACQRPKAVPNDQAGEFVCGWCSAPTAAFGRASVLSVVGRLLSLGRGR
jgi:hypothetical protein